MATSPKERFASSDAPRFHRRMVWIRLAFALLRLHMKGPTVDTSSSGAARQVRGAPMNLETVRDKRKADAPGKTSINRDVPLTRLIAGVSVPDKPLITAVIEYAQR